MNFVILIAGLVLGQNGKVPIAPRELRDLKMEDIVSIKGREPKAAYEPNPTEKNLRDGPELISKISTLSLTSSVKYSKSISKPKELEEPVLVFELARKRFGVVYLDGTFQIYQGSNKNAKWYELDRISYAFLFIELHDAVKWARDVGKS